MCKYCNGDEAYLLDDSPIDSYIELDRTPKITILVYHGDGWSLTERNIDIKYCPMCGRKLIEDISGEDFFAEVESRPNIMNEKRD